MKRLFFSITLMFTCTLLWAQGASMIKYVSFFPPAHIVHSEVILNQNKDSFDYISETDKQVNTGDYHARSGGLILGAAKDAEITIKEFNIAGKSSPEEKFYAVRKFNVENLIEISSFGQIGIVYVGSPCGKLENAQCKTSFLSAYKVSLPLVSNYDPSTHVILKSSNISNLSGVALLNDHIFLKGVSSGDALKWVNLRVDGTGECRRYLVRYKGTAPGNQCRTPNDLTPC